MSSDDSDLPFVSVVISHVNSARTIATCLEHLGRLDYPNTKCEIVVVDAGSVDGSIALVEKLGLSNVRQIVAAGCAEAEGQSLAIQKSRGDVIMFTNSDIYVPQDWVRKHVEWLEKGHDLVGGAVFWGGDKYTLTWNLPLPKSPYFRVEPGLGLGFSNCSVRKSFLNKVGGLKNLSSQHDAEFVLRSIAMGGRLILDPKIEVYHDHPFKSFYGNFKRSFGYAINHVTVVRAMFGKIVVGSGMPLYVSAGMVLREASGLDSIRTYRELWSRVRKWEFKIATGPAEFIFIRIFSTKLGQLAGVMAGSLSRRVTLLDVKELHTSRLTSNGSPAHTCGDVTHSGGTKTVVNS